MVSVGEEEQMGWEREPAKATSPLGKVHSQSSQAGGFPVCHHPQEDTVNPNVECVYRRCSPTGVHSILQQRGDPDLYYRPTPFGVPALKWLCEGQCHLPFRKFVSLVSPDFIHRDPD